MLTTGHLACAVDRTPRTIRTWRKRGLLPGPPFVIHSDSFRNRRWLYPVGFVEALAEIAENGLIGSKMDPTNWYVFSRMVHDADQEFIRPLLGEGVMGPVVLSFVR